VNIAATRDSRGRHSHSYYMTVAEWPDATASREIRIRRDIYRWVREGMCIQVNWHVGRVGGVWVDGFERGTTTCEPGDWK
jgi:hypothetical protein